MRQHLYGLIAFTWVAPLSAQENFDRLSDADRAAFQKQFDKEVWPLLMRNAKNGCVGCHHPKVENVALRFSGDPVKDFPMLLKEGFFLVNDSGSILDRVKSKSPDRRMPPGSRPSWTAEEVKVLSDFMDAMAKKQKKK